MATASLQTPIGPVLREWRERRRLTQLELALDAGISPRHLSFVENGRSKPGRELLLRVLEQLEVPVREQNRLLLASGHAPAFPERALEDAELQPVREALDQILTGHEPYPAVVVDRWWELVAANASVALFTGLAAPHLLEPPVNALRVTLHPEGMAPHILNLPEWRAHLLDRLRRQVAVTNDDQLAALYAEVAAYPGGEAKLSAHEPGIAVPLRIKTDAGELAFFSTIATFGTAVDITLAELAIEAFFPSDEVTAQALTRALSASRAGSPSVSNRTT
jgi:transcriptional regulator with XRE-family HTH domain